MQARASGTQRGLGGGINHAEDREARKTTENNVIVAATLALDEETNEDRVATGCSAGWPPLPQGEPLPLRRRRARERTSVARDDVLQSKSRLNRAARTRVTKINAVAANVRFAELETRERPNDRELASELNETELNGDRAIFRRCRAALPVCTSVRTLCNVYHGQVPRAIN